MITATPLDAALDFAARGLPVFPLHYPQTRNGVPACSCGRPGCDDQAKHPFFRLAPNGLKNATTDHQQVKEWWRRYPRLNIGVTTGTIIVLDVDPRHGGYESLAALETEHDVLPHTWTVRTGSDGRHLLFRRTHRHDHPQQRRTVGARPRYPRRGRIHHRSNQHPHYRQPLLVALRSR